MLVNGQPAQCHGAGDWPDEADAGDLIVAAGDYLAVSWATVRHLTVVELWGPGSLDYWINRTEAAAKAGAPCDGQITAELPLHNNTVEIAGLVFYNPSAEDIVLKGTGQTGSVLGWHGLRTT